MKKIILLSGGLLAITTTVILLSHVPSTKLYNNDSVAHVVTNNRIMYLNDTKLIEEYNQHLLEEKKEMEEEQKYINKVRKISKDINKIKHKSIIKKENKTYSHEDLMLLAGVVQNEAGSDFCSNYHQRCVCSVVLNRVNSNYFPNTIKEVILQKNQYDLRDGFYNPSKRAIKNAKYVLENGSILPSNCLFQSEFKQGDGVYGDPIKTPISTTYICYKN
jgi:hypothetical protein